MLILAYKGEILFEKESIPFLNVISIFTILVLFIAVMIAFVKIPTF